MEEEDHAFYLSLRHSKLGSITTELLLIDIQ